jgi:hypothetical protein
LSGKCQCFVGGRPRKLQTHRNCGGAPMGWPASPPAASGRAPHPAHGAGSSHAAAAARGPGHTALGAAARGRSGSTSMRASATVSCSQLPGPRPAVVRPPSALRVRANNPPSKSDLLGETRRALGRRSRGRGPPAAAVEAPELARGPLADARGVGAGRGACVRFGSARGYRGRPLETGQRFPVELSTRGPDSSKRIAVAGANAIRARRVANFVWRTTNEM